VDTLRVNPRHPGCRTRRDRCPPVVLPARSRFRPDIFQIPFGATRGRQEISILLLKTGKNEPGRSDQGFRQGRQGVPTSPCKQEACSSRVAPVRASPGGAPTLPSCRVGAVWGLPSPSRGGPERARSARRRGAARRPVRGRSSTPARRIEQRPSRRWPSSGGFRQLAGLHGRRAAVSCRVDVRP
jgi:hypothetical protein